MVELWEAVAEPEPPLVSCHCSVITELDNGDVLVGYYAGAGEARPDAAWVFARRTKKSTGFEPLQVVANSQGKPEGNGIAFQNAQGDVVLLYNTMQGRLDGPHGPGVRWRTCDLRKRISHDRGQTWSDVEMIDAEWGHVPRCKPIRLRSGIILFGTEYDDGNSRIWQSEDEGKTWQVIGKIQGEQNQHPTLLERTDGSILALLRPCGGQGCILQSESFDEGATWSPAQRTDLASPFAALDAVKLADGRFVVAWNSNPEARNPLTLALSEDEGKTWSHRRDLVIGEGSFHYPAIIQTNDGVLHVSFTNNRQWIDHIALSVEWIEGKGNELLPWNADVAVRRLG